MPRVGGIYSRPAGTDAVPDTTIESAKYNNNVADVEFDLNLPRPVTAGGTGADNAADAMTNLGGELAKQEIVNYDSDPFQAGSFYSAAGATNAPVVGHNFIGICYTTATSGTPPTSADLFIEARDQVTTGLYLRQKKAGVWQTWLSAAGLAAGPTPPTSPADNSFWWDPTRGKLFIRYNDGNSAQWVEAVAVPDVDPNTFVEIAGDTMLGPLILAADPIVSLGAATKHYVDSTTISITNPAPPTVPQQEVGRENLYAAPFDAMAYNGMQINGSTDLCQDNPTLSGVWINNGVSNYVVDGWILNIQQAIVGSTAFALSRTIPGTPSFGGAFQKCIQMTSTTAANFAGAVDLLMLQHPIEGYRWERLGFGYASAHPVTIGFWVYASIPGTACVTLTSSGTQARGYTMEYTVTTANTWEYKTLQFPPDIATPANWLTTNMRGATLSFCFGGGSTTKSSIPNTWFNWSNQYASAAQTNFFASNGNAVALTGVIVLAGSEAPLAARSSLIMRPYDVEQMLYKRQFDIINPGTAAIASGFGWNPALVICSRAFTTPMRAPPTIIFSGPFDVLMNTATYSVASGFTLGGVSDHDLRLHAIGSFGPAGQGAVLVGHDSTSRMYFDARL